MKNLEGRKMKTKKCELTEVARESIKKLLELGYSYEDIYNAIEYMSERDRLLSLTVNGGWKYICEHETLPLQFIEEFSDKLDWKLVSVYQKLNSEIISKFADKLDWFFIFMNQDLDDELLCKYKNNIRNAVYCKLSNYDK